MLRAWRRRVRPAADAGGRSISVLQWLLNAENPRTSPLSRLLAFFSTLHATLRNGARAVLQFYPESDTQVHLCMQAATRAGFGGGLVVDYPNSKKAKKLFLVLWVGGAMVPPPGWQGELASAKHEVPQGLVAEHEMGKAAATQVKYEKKRDGAKGKKGKGKRKSGESTKEWIVRKKELYRTRGKEVSVVVYEVAVHR
jgi:18S rRNA (guanine1575-N7)-methyltransferase